jgi:GT2 family glycosyltransferase
VCSSDLFNPALGVKGKKRMVGEETELMIRLWNTSADAAVYYDPDLCILHLVKPERMSLWWDFKRKLHYGWVRSRVFSARYRPLRLDRGRLVWILQMAHRILFACARPPIALLRGLAKAAVGVWLRDRKRYPFWQNYYYEVVFAEAMAVTSHLAYLLRPGGLWKSLRDTPLSTHQEQRQC